MTATVYNRYTVAVIDQHIRRQLHKHLSSTHTTDDHDQTKQVKLFYKGSMSSAYKKDEKVLHDIVYKNCIPIRPHNDMKLIIYYQSPTTSKLIMTNNPSRDTTDLKATNVIYEFKCPIGDCARRNNASYIGHTTTTLSRRITMHLQNGAPEKHIRSNHSTTLTRSMMVNNTSIIARCSKKKKLMVLEAVYIKDRDPLINRQMNLRGTLSVYDGRPLVPRVWQAHVLFRPGTYRYQRSQYSFHVYMKRI